MKGKQPDLTPGAKGSDPAPWSAGTGEYLTETEMDRTLACSPPPRSLPCSEGGRIPWKGLHAIYKASVTKL